MLRTLIVDGDYNWADQFATQAFSSDKLSVVGIEQDGQRAAIRIDEQNPSLVLVDQSAQDGDGIKVLERLIKENPNIFFVFTTTARGDLFLWRNAMSKGAQGVLYKPYAINDVLDALSQHLVESPQLDIGRQASGAQTQATLRAATGPPADSRVVKTQAGTGGVIKQEVICVYSPKGGVGKTTLACNVAAALSINKLMPIKVCLIDMDTSFGTVSSLLDVKNLVKYSVLDWEGYTAEEFDRRLIDQLVVKHKSGVDVIPAPGKAEEAALINRVDENGIRKGKELTEKMLKVLRGYYDIIVIDVGPSLREDSTITAIDSATKVLLLSAADVPTLNNVLSCQRTFDVLGIDQGKIRVVINRISKNNGLDMRMLNEIIPYMVASKLPDDYNVQRLANEGKLPVMDAKNLPFSQAVISLAGTLAPVYGTPKGPGFFARLFGKK